MVSGAVGGLLWAGGTFSLWRPSVATSILLVGLFGSLLVASRIHSWQIAVPPWMLAESAGAAFGAHLRWRVMHR